MDLVNRPIYHFAPLANWMNDPNGLIQWQGKYHLFYQHNPNGAYWDQMHWGHASSPDLVHWTHLPIALAPTQGGPDKDGCFSGCAINHNGAPTLVYTGTMPEVQCLATSSDGLLTWVKHPANPVIPTPPEGLQVTGFRDPCVWREGDAWLMALGSGFQDVGGAILLYRSTDLVAWKYLGPLCVGDKAETGHIWECPNFFPLGDKHVLIISPVPLKKAIYFVGSYRDHRFAPELSGDVDAGGHLYAPQVFEDMRGRRILFGWLWEGRSKESQKEAGWAGVMSLPRVLSLNADGSLCCAPAPALQTLRGESSHVQDATARTDSEARLEMQGDALELDVTIQPGDAMLCGLKVRCSPDGAEQTLIGYDRAQGCLFIDRSRSSLSESANHEIYRSAFILQDGEPLRWRVFLDHSVIEVFANDRACLTSRIYPTRADSLGIALFAQGGEARLETLDTWQMHSMWA